MLVIGFFLAAAIIGILMGFVYERTRLQQEHEQRQREAREDTQYLTSMFGRGADDKEGDE